MDLTSLTSLNSINALGMQNTSNLTSLTGSLLLGEEEVQGTAFSAFLNSAISNISTTNSYLSDAENEEIKFALGETENTHDLMVSLNKASTALQYTVAIRDKLLDAYKELMQMQI